MDLESMNKEYVELKSKMKDMQDDIDKLSKNIEKLADDKVVAQAEKIQASRTGDSATVAKQENEIKKIEDELKRIKEDCEKKKESLKGIQTQINTKIKELSQDPGMKEHLDNAINKNYQRKISKMKDNIKEDNELKAKNEEKMNKNKERITLVTNLSTMLKSEPSINSNLKEIAEAQKEIKKLKKELAIDGITEDRKNEIKRLMKDAESRINKNKFAIIGLASTKGIPFSDKDISELANIDILDKSGNIDLDKAKDGLTQENDRMMKENKRINKEIAGYNKSIKNYENSIISSPESKDFDMFLEGEHPEEEVKPADKSSEKPKWYQFIKRFKNWREKKKAEKALPEVKEEPKKEEPKKEDKTKEFVDSLKYELARDVYQKEIEERVREGKKKRKEEERKSKPKDDDKDR